jgi:hypothetical protein
MAAANKTKPGAILPRRVLGFGNLKRGDGTAAASGTSVPG